MSKALGILGGGQLGRMTAMAAARLGIQCHIYAPEAGCPASHVAVKHIQAAYDNESALAKFAQNVDVITYEFENIPLKTVQFLQQYKAVHPDDRLLEISQHRAREKTFLNNIGIETAGWAHIQNPDQVKPAMEQLGLTKGIIKTSQFGYDGKGQMTYDINEDVNVIWSTLTGSDFVLEEIVDFSVEISVCVARDKLGQTITYEPSLNEHRNHILYKSTSPASLPEATRTRAKAMGVQLAEAIDLVGVMTLELFVCDDGRLLANEIAPRPHNSFHWTIDACAVSQFEQHVRTVCGLPVGLPAQHSDVEMMNILGNDIAKAHEFLEIEGACLHDYGKGEAKDGRKMGHVTFLKKK